MKRRYGRSRWPEATAVVGMFVLVVVVMIGNWGEERGVDPVRDMTPAPEREIAGHVVGNGQPIAGVALALYEADFGPVAEAVSAEDGSFSMRWTGLCLEVNLELHISHYARPTSEPRK